jgi:hypothetical protein
MTCTADISHMANGRAVHQSPTVQSDPNLPTNLRCISCWALLCSPDRELRHPRRQINELPGVRRAHVLQIVFVALPEPVSTQRAVACAQILCTCIACCGDSTGVLQPPCDYSRGEGFVAPRHFDVALISHLLLEGFQGARLVARQQLPPSADFSLDLIVEHLRKITPIRDQQHAVRGGTRVCYGGSHSPCAPAPRARSTRGARLPTRRSGAAARASWPISACSAWSC